MSGATAYVDESFHEHPTRGFYVLAAAVFSDESEHARTAMLALRGGRRTQKLHWNEMDDRQQRGAAAVVAGLDGMHLVTIGSPVPPKKQERARRAGLRRLAYELHGVGVTQIMMESRQRVLDRQDVGLITATRNDLPKGTRLRVDHQRGAEEPLFWAADIVAGAVRADREGVAEYRETLGALVQTFEVPC
ncbi:DUF3800 domain-containing protein [Pseudonocardia sp. KRD291]|uniref:DUF3800 domain-containing protein n=1 Tax=Pseudonocardia sp. KRD291 TaxID=2792007 RepID=UPI001CF7CC53|nr:DUF3800 domain-containing protein [Pseudonocardia sp. KRD291]